MLHIITNAPISENDKSLVEQLFVKYHRLMLHVAGKYFTDTAMMEDVASEALVKMIRHRDKLRNVSSPQTKVYIVNMVRTTALDMLKQGGTRKYETEDLLEEVSDERVNIEDEVISQSGCDSVMAAFRALPEMLREVAYRFFVFENSHEEIAQLLGISVSASQKRLSRARALIKKMLAGENSGKQLETRKK